MLGLQVVIVAQKYICLKIVGIQSQHFLIEFHRVFRFTAHHLHLCTGYKCGNICRIILQPLLIKKVCLVVIPFVSVANGQFLRKPRSCLSGFSNACPIEHLRLSRIRIGSLTEQTHGIIVLTCRQGISHLLQQYICRLCQKRHRTQQESEEKKSQGFHFKVYIVKQPEISQ